MIVRHFLRWIETASSGDRADAVSALARAYLYSDMSEDDRAAAEGALVMLLDDPSPLVRFAMATALAASPDAPHAVILALAADHPDIATLVFERSPVLIESELVDAVATGSPDVQCAIARRISLPTTVAAAIAEVGGPEAVLVLLESESAVLPRFSLARIVERHGHLAPVREALLAREDLDPQLRQALIARLADTLAGFVTHRNWLSAPRAEQATREACDKATVAIAAETPHDGMAAFVRHLIGTRQLTANLILRALLSGNVTLFAASLAVLSGVDEPRVHALLRDRHGTGLRALYEKARLPAAAWPAFAAAIAAIAETGFAGDERGAAALRRRIVERTLTGLPVDAAFESGELMGLLRRFAAEAAREEARHYCADLAA
jgi:uncharacterized protein (DUF2336 family)